MLQRLANLVLGAVIFTLAGSMLLLHLTSEEPAQALVLLLSGVLMTGAAACVRAGLIASTHSVQRGPVLSSGGAEAAWRLRDLKRIGSSRYLGLRGLSALAPWKL